MVYHHKMESQLFLQLKYLLVHITAAFLCRNRKVIFVIFFPMKNLRRKILEREKHVKELSSMLQFKKVSDQLF